MLMKLALLVALTSVAMAQQTLYVGPSGTDAANNNCTSDTAPCFTLCQAFTQIDQSVATTINVAAGTYDYSGDDARCHEPTANTNSTLIQGAGSATTILDYGGVDVYNGTSGWIIYITNAGFVEDASFELNGLTFFNVTNPTIPGSTIEINDQYQFDADDVKFDSCTTRDLFEVDSRSADNSVVSRIAIVDSQIPGNNPVVFKVGGGNVTFTDFSVRDSSCYSTFFSFDGTGTLNITNFDINNSNAGFEVDSPANAFINDVTLDCNGLEAEGGAGSFFIIGDADTLTLTGLSARNCYAFSALFELTVQVDATLTNVVAENLDGDYTLVYAEDGSNLNLVMDTWTVSNVNTSSDGTIYWVNSGDFTIRDSTFQNMWATGGGGTSTIAYFEDAADVTVERCNFENINCEDGTPGFYMEAGSITHTDSSWTNCNSLGNDFGVVGSFGGDLPITLERLNITDCFSERFGAIYLNTFEDVFMDEIMVKEMTVGTANTGCFVHSVEFFEISNSVFSGCSGDGIEPEDVYGVVCHDGCEMESVNISGVPGVAVWTDEYLGFSNDCSVHNNPGQAIVAIESANVVHDGSLLVYSNNAANVSTKAIECVASLLARGGECVECDCAGQGGLCFLPGMNSATYDVGNNTGNCVCHPDVQGEACNTCIDDPEEEVFQGDFFDGACAPTGDADGEDDEEVDDDDDEGAGMASGPLPSLIVALAAMIGAFIAAL